MNRQRGGPGSFDRPPGQQRRPRRNVRAAVLTLLAERPMTGSEMIEELSSRSGGQWNPTPGAIYPTLQMLDDDALVTSVQSADGKRRYQLTDAGRDEAERHAATSRRKPWEPPGEASTDLLAAIAEAGRMLLAAAATGDDEQRAEIAAALDELRRRLAAIVPDAASTSGPRFGGWRPGPESWVRGRAGSWSVNLPDWLFGPGGPLAGGWPWSQPAEEGRPEPDGEGEEDDGGFEEDDGGFEEDDATEV